MKKNKSSKLIDYINSSFFVTIFQKLSDFLYNKIISSKTAQFFTSYDNIIDKSKKSTFNRIVSFIKPKPNSVLSFKNIFSGLIENSFFYKFYIKFINFLLGSKSRSYGLFFLIYGLSSTLIGLIRRYFILIDESSSLIFQGICYVILSLPLLVAKDSIGFLLAEGRFSRPILCFLELDLDGIKKYRVKDTYIISITCALLFGLLTPIVSPFVFAFAEILLLVVFLVFHKPEIGVLMTIVFLPFLPTMLICAEVILVWFAFTLKLMRGKRTIKFEIIDLLILFFAVYLFLGGAFSVSPKDSILPACVFACFMSFYFIIVNLVRTEKFAKKILYSSICTFFLCAIYGIYQNFFAAPDTTWTDEDMFSEIETRVVSTFENPNVFGEYLILLLPIVITFLIISKTPNKKAFSFACLASGVMALIYTWSRGAWLGAIIAMAIFLVIISRKAIVFYLLSLISVPFLIPFLPSSIINRFTSIGNMTDSSTSYRVFIWEASVNMIRDYFFTGIGVGTTAFQTVYSEYALSGIETAPHSHNLYLQIFVELGIFGFILFAIVMFLYFSKGFTFLRKCADSSSRLIIGASMCGVIAFLAQGLTDYVWYNYRVFALFWMVIGLSVAVIKAFDNECLELSEINN